MLLSCHTEVKRYIQDTPLSCNSSPGPSSRTVATRATTEKTIKHMVNSQTPSRLGVKEALDQEPNHQRDPHSGHSRIFSREEQLEDPLWMAICNIGPRTLLRYPQCQLVNVDVAFRRHRAREMTTAAMRPSGQPLTHRGHCATGRAPAQLWFSQLDLTYSFHRGEGYTGTTSSRTGTSRHGIEHF